MSKSVTESQFYMWRTLFAVAHADNVVTDEEISFMAHVIDDVNFTPEQTEILKDDIVNAKDIVEMFHRITEQDDRNEFFNLARDLVWVDGDFGSEEQDVMIKLFREHFVKTDVDELIGKVSLTLEDEDETDGLDRKRYGHNHRRSFVMSFRDRFAEKLGLKPKE